MLAANAQKRKAEGTGRTVHFTEKELAVLEALVVCGGSYREAAKRAMMKPGTLRATTFRIRLRYDNALRFVEECEKYQKRLPRRKRFITG